MELFFVPTIFLAKDSQENMLIVLAYSTLDSINGGRVKLPR